MINLDGPTAAAIKHAGGLRPLIDKMTVKGDQLALRKLNQLYIAKPADIERVQPGCRVVDSVGRKYIKSDLIWLVDLETGQTVLGQASYPLEVTSCPK